MSTVDMKIRLPAGLKAWLKEQADTNHRKMNGELLAILERAMATNMQEKA